MSKLKRCPFCNEKAWIFKTHEGTYAVMHESSDCPITSESFQGNWVYDSLEEAINAWNTRTPMDKVIERLEEYANDLKEGWDKYDNEDDFGGYCAVSRAIEIIKEELM